MAKTEDAGVEEEVPGAPQEQEATGSEVINNTGSAEGDRDVEALLEEEKAAHAKTAKERDNLRTALQQKRQLRKKPAQAEEHVEEEEEEQVDEEDRPATVKDITRIINANRDQANVDSIAAEMVQDPRKRELVLSYYNTRIVKTGTSVDAVRADIQTALDLADSRITKRKNEELKRMNNNSNDTPPLKGTGADNHHDTSKDHGWSEAQVKELTARAQSIGITDVSKYLRDSWQNAKRPM